MQVLPLTASPRDYRSLHPYSLAAGHGRSHPAAHREERRRPAKVALWAHTSNLSGAPGAETNPCHAPRHLGATRAMEPLHRFSSWEAGRQAGWDLLPAGV